MIHILKDEYSDLYSQLRSEGYVIVPFLDNIQIPQLIEIYTTYKIKNIHQDEGLHMTTWIGDFEEKINLKNRIENILYPSFEKYFKDWKVLNTTFIIKKKSKYSNFPLHQDWSFVDETNYEALNIWIPLQDTTIKNGGLCVIKGTHKLNKKLRGAGKISQDFSKIQDKLVPYTSSIRVRRGEAIFFYYSLIHGSPDNLTKFDRIVISTSVMPKEAPFILNYHNIDNNTIEQYQMDDTFIYKYSDIKSQSITTPPNGRLINTVKYIEQDYTLSEILNATTTQKKNKLILFFDKFFSNFKI